ncbi:hypothetical protein [Actinomadura rudentiformis]|nr:hypothetical protein [Actinomadura rudentiformis]
MATVGSPTWSARLERERVVAAKLAARSRATIRIAAFNEWL